MLKGCWSGVLNVEHNASKLPKILLASVSISAKTWPMFFVEIVSPNLWHGGRADSYTPETEAGS
jgi:hypothetical protein